MPFSSFVEQSFSSSFERNTMPRLLVVYKAEGKHTQIPRVMHNHDDRIEIVFIRSGCGLHNIDGERYYTQKGDILIYNSGVIHDECVNADVNMSVYCCAIADLKMPELPLNHLVPQGMKAVVPGGKYSEHIEKIFEMIYYHTLLKNFKFEEFTNYLVRALIVLVFGIIQNTYQRLLPKDNLMGKRIKSYLDKCCLDDINLDTMSQQLHISQYYLSHIFKKMHSYSPMQYVIRRRIGEAQSLLLNSNHDITKIATMVGYNNPNYFHSIFMKIVGMSPGKYRKFHWMNEEFSENEKNDP